MNETISSILKITSLAIELFSVVVLIYGTGVCAFEFLVSRFKKQTDKASFLEITAIKNKLATYILLGLEILIVADIIDSIISPNFLDIAILASIVVIRTVISFFLAKEIEDYKDMEKE